MSSQSEHILVLEDNPQYQYVLEQTFSNAGFTVTTAERVDKALVLAKIQHFDLAIVDYHLPDHPGTHFITLLRAIDQYEHTPVILVTAWTDELNLEYQCRDLSIVTLSKMGGVKQALETVRKCLAAARSAS